MLKSSAAYCIVADITVSGIWIDNFRMPADAPTRDGGIVVATTARSSVALFLQGDVPSLDSRLDGGDRSR